MFVLTDIARYLYLYYIRGMKKILAIIRVSTEAQTIEDQHNEMLEFIKSEGYAEDSIVWLEEKGASAAGLNQKYMDMIEEMKRLISSDPDIGCVAVWHLNRLFRTEEAYVDVKVFLVKRQIQLITKNPYLKLLRPDGSVDQGMELAISLLALLSKQENEERLAKMRRAKRGIRKRGQWQGGPKVKFGYKVDKDRYLVEDKESADIVRLIFTLYSTGNYSAEKLKRELKERGITLARYTISEILTDRGYAGEISDKVPDRRLPPLISKELFEKCEEVRASKRWETAGQEPVLGSGLLVCPSCGCHYVKSGINYRCGKGKNGSCPSTITIRSEIFEALLWRVASVFHSDYLLEYSESKGKEYREKISVLEGKVQVIQNKLEGIEEKKGRVLDLYVEGLIDRKEKDKRLAKIEEETSEDKERLESLIAERDSYMGLIREAEQGNVDWEAFTQNIEASFQDKQRQYDIIHQHIKEVSIERYQFGELNKRRSTDKPNALHLSIKAKIGEVWEYLYLPMVKKGIKVYQKTGRSWKPL